MYFLLKDDTTEIQFVFSHITKNGGSTIRGCVDNSCTDKLFTQVDRSPFMKKEWKYKFSFAIHRNPYTRFLSAFSDFKDNRKQPLTLHGVTTLLKRFDYDKAVNDTASLEHHLLQQTHAIWGESEVDYMLAQESLNEDLEALMRKFDIKVEMKATKNRTSDSERYLNQLSGQQIRVLNEFYHEDFHRFAYEKVKIRTHIAPNVYAFVLVLLLVEWIVNRHDATRFASLSVAYITICIAAIAMHCVCNRPPKDIFFNEHSIYISKFHLFTHLYPELFTDAIPNHKRLPQSFDRFDHKAYYRYFKASFYRSDVIVEKFNRTKNLEVFAKYSNHNFNIVNMITYLRRNRNAKEAPEVFKYFKKYVERHLEFIMKMTDARHLLSIVKTFGEYGSGMERHNAILLNTIGVEYKLMLTYKSKPKEAYTFQNNRSPLQPFFFTGHEDLFKNEYLHTLKRTLENTPTIFMLWKAFMRWMVVYDNCFMKEILSNTVEHQNYKKEMAHMIFSMH